MCDCTPTFGGSTRESSGLLSGILTITLTLNGAMREIPKCGAWVDWDISGYGKLSLCCELSKTLDLSSRASWLG